MEKPIRLSQRLTEFRRDLDRLSKAERDKVLEGVRASIGKPRKSRELQGGSIVVARDVDLSRLVDSVPGSLREDARVIERAVNAEAQRRGQQWAAEALHLTIDKYVLDPAGRTGAAGAEG